VDHLSALIVALPGLLDEKRRWWYRRTGIAAWFDLPPSKQSSLLDRGYGRPPQALEHGGANSSLLAPLTEPDDAVEIARTIAFALAIADKSNEKQSGEGISSAGRNTASRAAKGVGSRRQSTMKSRTRGIYQAARYACYASANESCRKSAGEKNFHNVATSMRRCCEGSLSRISLNRPRRQATRTIARGPAMSLFRIMVEATDDLACQAHRLVGETYKPAGRFGEIYSISDKIECKVNLLAASASWVRRQVREM
jgi:hypothetical protein